MGKRLFGNVLVYAMYLDEVFLICNFGENICCGRVSRVLINAYCNLDRLWKVSNSNAKI